MNRDPSLVPFLDNLWRRTCGMKEIELLENVPDLEILKETQWSNEFESLMRNRLIMGAFRYGIFGLKDKPKFNSVNSIIQKAKLYQETGNDEILVDIANLAMVEFIEGNHPNKHYKAVDDGIHTEIKEI